MIALKTNFLCLAIVFGIGGSLWSADPQQKGDTLIESLVMPGDSFWKIAKRRGCKVGDLMAENPEVPENGLRVGRYIKLPPNRDRESRAVMVDVTSINASLKVKAGSIVEIHLQKHDSCGFFWDVIDKENGKAVAFTDAMEWKKGADALTILVARGIVDINLPRPSGLCGDQIGDKVVLQFKAAAAGTQRFSLRLRHGVNGADPSDASGEIVVEVY